jgi:hypothetical protein
MPYVLHATRQLTRSVWKKISRKGLRVLMPLASEEEKIAAERRLRGREEVRKLRLADVVIASFGKSGRTWLRVMLSRVYQLMYNLPQRYLLGFDNLHNVNREIPRIFMTHDNYIKDFTGHADSKVDFYDKKVVLLVRDPRDVAVSQFFQWKFRMKPGKKSLNQYPEGGTDCSIYEFLMRAESGLPKIIDFMNLWASEASQIRQFMLLRYEDLRADPKGSMKALMEFMGTPATDQQIEAAVEFGSYENMKKMEQKKVFWLSGGRMVPKDRANPDSYKVRRAKVGGYRDYFTDEELERITALVDSTLSPYFGYSEQRDQAAFDASSDSARASG